jgi:hypothetical protein
MSRPLALKPEALKVSKTFRSCTCSTDFSRNQAADVILSDPFAFGPGQVPGAKNLVVVERDPSPPAQGDRKSVLLGLAPPFWTEADVESIINLEASLWMGWGSNL